MHLHLRSLLTLAGFAAVTTFSLAHEGHDHATKVAAATADNYPLTTCIVSGDKLGEDGEPVKYTYKQPGKPDRLIEFCCKDCIKDFEKDPAKYIAKLDAAAAGKAASHTDSCCTKDAACCSAGASCCANHASTVSAKAGCCASGDASCCELVTAYLPIAGALAADDLGKAKAAATTLATEANADGMMTIATPAHALANAADIKAARAAFKTLSSEVAPLVENAKGYVVMHCPMADADWIQTDANARNPYYGKKMLTCGEPKKA